MYYVEIGRTAKCWLSEEGKSLSKTVEKEDALVFGSIEKAKQAIQASCKLHPTKKEVFYSIVDDSGKFFFEYASAFGQWV